MMRRKIIANIRSISKFPSETRKSIWVGLACIVAFVLSFLLFSMPAVRILDWRLADFWSTQEYGSTTSSSVAVIGIDEALFEEQGFDWPLEKDVYGDLIAFLVEMEAKVIVFDILFADNLYACGKGDSVLQGMMEYAHNVILGFGALVYQDDTWFGPAKSRPIPKRFSIGHGNIPGLNTIRTVLPLDKIRVKGKNAPTAIYQLLGKIREGDGQLKKLIVTYENALQLYFNQKFGEAGNEFASALKLERYPKLMNPSSVMMGRCNYFARKVPELWDGVYTMRGK